jgi:alcohol dehydrogenase
MRVACIREHGSLDVLRLEDWPEPVANAGQAVIEVAFCGLNHLDMFVLRGMPGVPIPFPRIPGADISGTVRRVGPGVSADWIGKRVLVDNIVIEGKKRMSLGEHLDGGLCQFAAVPADNLVPLPDSVSFEHATALPTAYGTVEKMLVDRGRVKKGELMLVLGASGGVGVGCVQIGKALGLRIIACASSAEKIARLKALGADEVVDYSKEDFSAAAWRLSDKQGVDVVVNFTGGDTWVPSIRCLRRFGRLLVCGATAGYDPQEDIRYIWIREIEIIGSNGWDREHLHTLVEKVRNGSLLPVIDEIVPLAETRRALEKIERRAVFGKILVKP